MKSILIAAATAITLHQQTIPDATAQNPEELLGLDNDDTATLDLGDNLILIADKAAFKEKWGWKSFTKPFKKAYKSVHEIAHSIGNNGCKLGEVYNDRRGACVPECHGHKKFDASAWKCVTPPGYGYSSVYH